MPRANRDVICDRFCTVEAATILRETINGFDIAGRFPTEFLGIGIKMRSTEESIETIRRISPEAAKACEWYVDALRRSEFSVETRLSSDQGRVLLGLLGLDRAIAAGDGAAQFEGSVSGVWRAPLRLSARLTGTGLAAEAQGSAEPWAQDASASANLRVRGVNLAPLPGR